MSILNNITLVFFLLLGILGYGQNSTDFHILRQNAMHIKPQKKKVKEEYKENLVNNKSELQYVMTGLFFIYKDFFSSQDFNHCVFHPSCSVYCIESIKKKGLVKGSLKTFDRLTRCNGFSNQKYEKDFERKRLLDPVEN